jgi:hypothetical protein
MAKIIPLERYVLQETKCLVTCRSYEEYVTAELAAQLDFNPLSFLHIINLLITIKNGYFWKKIPSSTKNTKILR